MIKPKSINLPTATEIKEMEASGFVYKKHDGKRIIGSAWISGLSILFLEDGSEVIKDKAGKVLNKWPDEVKE